MLILPFLLALPRTTYSILCRVCRLKKFHPEALGSTYYESPNNCKLGCCYFCKTNRKQTSDINTSRKCQNINRIAYITYVDTRYWIVIENWYSLNVNYSNWIYRKFKSKMASYDSDDESLSQILLPERDVTDSNLSVGFPNTNSTSQNNTPTD